MHACLRQEPRPSHCGHPPELGYGRRPEEEVGGGDVLLAQMLMITKNVI